MRDSLDTMSSDLESIAFNLGRIANALERMVDAVEVALTPAILFSRSVIRSLQ